MKIVKIKGGLGNQLFQYSYAYLLKKLTGEEVKIDMSAYSSLKNDIIRVPRLLRMKISLPIASDNEVKSVCIFNHKGNSQSNMYRAMIAMESSLNRRYFFEKNRAYIDPSTIKDNCYFDGYWQSWRYVDPIWKDIKSEFVPNYTIHNSTKQIISEVASLNSVFIGIRKGDYSGEQNHYGEYGNSYYSDAMDYICEHINLPVFYIFSNDIAWVKKHIDFKNRLVVFREQDQIVDDFEELLIMASCKHSIIGNSTYHWWGARLNDSSQKIVISPLKWFFDEKPIDIIPPRWIKMN